METAQFETRLARLEVHVEHMGSDISEIKGQLHNLRTSMDAKFEIVNQKFDAINQKFDVVNQTFAQLLEKMVEIKVWALIVLGGGLGFGILGVLARALHWI